MKYLLGTRFFCKLRPLLIIFDSLVVSSSILSNGRFLRGADAQGSRAESSVGTFVSRAPSEAEMSRGRASNRLEPLQYLNCYIFLLS